MLTLLTTLFVQASPLPALNDWMAARGYPSVRADGAAPARQTLSYRNEDGEVNVVWKVFPSLQDGKFPTRNGELVLERDFDFMAPGDVSFAPGAPGAMPLGTDAWTLSNESGAKIRLRTPWMRMDVLASPFRSGSKDAPKDTRTFIEGAARHAVALVESRRLEKSADHSLTRGRIRVWEDADGLVFADLATWATLWGWTSKVDDDAGTTTLTREGHTLVIPLGAAAIKARGKWFALPDVVMLKEGKWWVPLDALEAAAK